jgi:hypothetical protein
VCESAFCVISEDRIPAVVLSGSSKRYVVGLFDIRSSVTGEDDKFSITVVVSIVSDRSTPGMTLLLLLTLLSTEDEVIVYVGKLVLYMMAEVVCESAFCVTSDDRIPALVVW